MRKERFRELLKSALRSAKPSSNSRTLTPNLRGLVPPVYLRLVPEKHTLLPGPLWARVLERAKGTGVRGILGHSEGQRKGCLEEVLPRWRPPGEAELASAGAGSRRTQY